MEFFESLKAFFYSSIIEQDRYKIIISGLKNTLIISFFATILGIALGMIVAVTKYFAKGNGNVILKGFDKLCSLYITVVRGTPVMVQLFIWSLVVLASWTHAIPVACIGFGFNSGAYVAEIFRAGIEAVDVGQEEAGRSLGLTRISTMKYIVMPQAIKNILPALGNEFITLLKETSVAGYIAVNDLTMAGSIIKSNTWDGRIYFVIALIYLVMVMAISKVLKTFERRLAKGDKSK
jgi:His/Glu/Gln/Arg/opine family amino acid ABC transporter permease subunit